MRNICSIVLSGLFLVSSLTPSLGYAILLHGGDQDQVAPVRRSVSGAQNHHPIVSRGLASVGSVYQGLLSNMVDLRNERLLNAVAPQPKWLIALSTAKNEDDFVNIAVINPGKQKMSTMNFAKRYFLGIPSPMGSAKILSKHLLVPTNPPPFSFDPKNAPELVKELRFDNPLAPKKNPVYLNVCKGENIPVGTICAVDRNHLEGVRNKGYNWVVVLSKKQQESVIVAVFRPDAENAPPECVEVSGFQHGLAGYQIRPVQMPVLWLKAVTPGQPPRGPFEPHEVIQLIQAMNQIQPDSAQHIPIPFTHGSDEDIESVRRPADLVPRPKSA